MRTRYLFSVQMDRLPVLESDFLIIGSGIAGLFAAYRARAHGSVLLITKEVAENSNSDRAQGGIAAAVDEDDSPVLHLEDTLEAGAGLCDSGSVEVLVTEGPGRVMELVELGVRFDREGGAWALGREAAHSRRRILHATDATGDEIIRALLRYCRSDRRILLKENAFLVEFLREPCSGVCSGALILDGAAERLTLCRARVVITATGGAGQLYLNTTNPGVATGDGMAAAYRAGAEMMDMEFVQFHPTALALNGAPRFLISEAVRGEGAFLKNVEGRRFMPDYHQKAELAPRDVVSRAIRQEMERTGADRVYLDISEIGYQKFQRRFPNITRTCLKFGLDLSEGSIPVAPAAHYIMGGVRTGLDAETSIPGLYACGEVACSGVHGANRLASNSLLEGLVFGARAVDHAVAYLKGTGGRLPAVPERIEGRRPPDDSGWDGHRIRELAQRVRTLMWQKAGIERNRQGLSDVLEELNRLEREACYPLSRAGVEAANLLTLGWLTATAALLRTESRGGHYRFDYPNRNDDCWLRHIVFQI